MNMGISFECLDCLDCSNCACVCVCVCEVSCTWRHTYMHTLMNNMTSVEEHLCACIRHAMWADYAHHEDSMSYIRHVYLWHAWIEIANVRRVYIRHAYIGHAHVGIAWIRYAGMGHAYIRHTHIGHAYIGHTHIQYRYVLVFWLEDLWQESGSHTQIRHRNSHVNNVEGYVYVLYASYIHTCIHTNKHIYTRIHRTHIHRYICMNHIHIHTNINAYWKERGICLRILFR